MNLDNSAAVRIWADNNAAYGPVDVPTLLSWIKDERVFPTTLVQLQADHHWRQAQAIEGLREHFAPHELASRDALQIDTHAVASDLRGLTVFQGVSNAGLEQIAGLGQFYEAPTGCLVVRKGDPCDAVYFVLSGELRVRLVVGVVDKADKTLCKIGPGEVFGEMGLFLQGTRTADVLAESPSRLFRMSTNACMLMVRQIPDLASAFLFNVCVTMAQRMSADNQRFYREVTSQFLWG